MNRRAWIIFGAIIAVMVLIGVVGVTGANLSDTETSTSNVMSSNWYDYSWLYRQPITVNNAGSALTDYQLSLTVNTQALVTAGKMRADGNDIYFTSSDGQTGLSYWIDSGMNTTTTVIWVKVTSIPVGTPAITIYLYYGNSGVASPASNGDNTFIYFNDFESSADVTEWTEVNAGTGKSRTLSSAQYSHGSYSMYVDDGATGGTYGVYAGFTSQNGTFTVDYDIRPVQNTMRWEMSLRSTSNIGTRLRFSNTADGSDVEYSIGNTYYSLPTATTYSANTWYSFTLDEINTQGSPNDLYDVWINGSQKADNIQWSSNRSNLNRFYFVSLTNAETPKVYIDAVRVRVYAATLPTYSIGAEE